MSRTVASATAWYAVTLIGGIPGMVITLLVAQVRYHPGFTISPLVVPATLLIVFVGTPYENAAGQQPCPCMIVP